MKLSVTMTARGSLLVGIDNPGIIQRDWGRAVRAALYATLIAWWQDFLPRHFRRGAHFRYSYRTRKSTTYARKQKLYGHNLELVNHPVGSPPTNRETLEAAMTRVPDQLIVRGSSATARWNVRASVVDEAHQDEITKTPLDEQQELGVNLHDSLYSAIIGKRWGRAKKPAGNVGGSVREPEIQRFRKYKIV